MTLLIISMIRQEDINLFIIIILLLPTADYMFHFHTMVYVDSSIFREMYAYIGEISSTSGNRVQQISRLFQNSLPVSEKSEDTSVTTGLTGRDRNCMNRMQAIMNYSFYNMTVLFKDECLLGICRSVKIK